MDKEFPKIKREVLNFMYNEDGNITRKRIIALGSILILLGMMDMDEVYAKHSSHSSHKSHSSHSSTSYHRSHSSHSSHASHSNTHGSHASHNNTHGSHASHSNTHSSHASHNNTHGSHASHNNAHSLHNNVTTKAVTTSADISTIAETTIPVNTSPMIKTTTTAVEIKESGSSLLTTAGVLGAITATGVGIKKILIGEKEPMIDENDDKNR